MIIQMCLVIVSVLSFTSLTWGQTKGCQIVPNDAVTIADKLIKKVYYGIATGDRSLSVVPDQIPINTRVQHQGKFDESVREERAQYEVLLRPKKTGFFHLLKIILFKLERDRNMLYVCLNEDSSRPEESHLTIYFLFAYGLERKTWERENLSLLPGDWLWGPDGLFRSPSGKVAQLTRLPVILTPIHLVTDDAVDMLSFFPSANSFLRVPGAILKLGGNLLNRANAKLGAGVERIVIKKDVVEFANFVDPLHPEKANTLFRWHRPPIPK